MRKQFINTLQNILYTNDKSILLLGDIGVFGFRNELKNIPDRVYNIGILEQSTIGIAAGLSKSGLIPFVHTIAPFLIERALEQLKIDFGYQNLNGNFISVGSSYDYAALGCTHHCPADISLLLTIPNMQIVVPGTSQEFHQYLTSEYNNGCPTYFRLSEYENPSSNLSPFGKGTVIQYGTKATVICYGNMLVETEKACRDLDITLLYYNTVTPFDSSLLQDNFSENIIICEPFYEGTTNHLVSNALIGKRYRTYNIGVPRKFLTNYGTKQQHDEHLGLTAEGIYGKLLQCIR
jgi:transketolase